MEGRIMKKTGIILSAAGILTGWVGVNMEPCSLTVCGAGILMLVLGLALILYQNYREEELAEEQLLKEKRRRRQQEKRDAMFQAWKTSTNLKEG